LSAHRPLAAQAALHSLSDDVPSYARSCGRVRYSLSSVIFIVVGSGTVLFGAYGLVRDVLLHPVEDDLLVMATLASSLIVAGLAILVVGLRRYRGGWLVVAAVATLLFAVTALSSYINAHLVNTYDAAFGIPVIAAAAVAGCLLLYLARLVHRRAAWGHQGDKAGESADRSA
jgi:hypothetical protein